MGQRRRKDKEKIGEKCAEHDQVQVQQPADFL